MKWKKKRAVLLQKVKATDTKIKTIHTSHMIEELSDEVVYINSNYYSNRKLASANLTTIQFFDHIYTT
jgi:hypothetical protein